MVVGKQKIFKKEKMGRIHYVKNIYNRSKILISRKGTDHE
jgi:hypothetical protein